MSESKRGWMPQLKWRANTPFLSLWFWSTLNSGLDNAHPHWHGLNQAGSQMLKSSRNTLTDTSEIMVYHLTRHHLIQSTSHKNLTNTRLKGQQRLSEAIGGLWFFSVDRQKGEQAGEQENSRKDVIKSCFGKKTKDTEQTHIKELSRNTQSLAETGNHKFVMKSIRVITQCSSRLQLRNRSKTPQCLLEAQKETNIY